MSTFEWLLYWEIPVQFFAIAVFPLMMKKAPVVCVSCTALLFMERPIKFNAILLSYVIAPNRLILAIISPLYSLFKWMTNHLVKNLLHLISWVVILRKKCTREMPFETSRRLCAKKTNQELHRTWKMFPNSFLAIDCTPFVMKNLVVFLILDWF